MNIRTSGKPSVYRVFLFAEALIIRFWQFSYVFEWIFLANPNIYFAFAAYNKKIKQDGN